MHTTTLSRALLVATLVAAAVSLSGCALISDAINGATTDEDDVFSLKVGDCVNDYGDEKEITSVPIVDCAELHDSEIYASTIITDDQYPGASEVQTQADDACYAAFEGFVGLAYDQSTLYYSYLYPTQESWDGGDREILCTIKKYDEDTQEIVPVTGSLKGSAE